MRKLRTQSANLMKVVPEELLHGVIHTVRFLGVRFRELIKQNNEVAHAVLSSAIFSPWQLGPGSLPRAGVAQRMINWKGCE